MRNPSRPTLRLLTSVVVALAAVAVAAAGCGSGDDSAGATTTDKATTTSSARRTVTTSAGDSGGAGAGSAGDSGGGDVEAGCAALQEVGQLQATMDAAMGADANDLATVQQVLGDAKPEIEGIYSRAAEALPDLEVQIDTVADLTIEAIDAIAAATTLEAGKQAVQALPGVTDAQSATLEIDAWTQENCGFAFAD